MTQVDVSGNIRAELARQRKTQEHLAAVLGITRQAISRRMRGYVVFDIDELRKIAHYLDVPLAELIDDARASA